MTDEIRKNLSSFVFNSSPTHNTGSVSPYSRRIKVDSHSPSGNRRGRVWEKEGVYHLPRPSVEDTRHEHFEAVPYFLSIENECSQFHVINFWKPHFSKTISLSPSFTLWRGSTTFAWFAVSVSSQAKFYHAIFPDAVKTIVCPFSRL